MKPVADAPEYIRAYFSREHGRPITLKEVAIDYLWQFNKNSQEKKDEVTARFNVAFGQMLAQGEIVTVEPYELTDGLEEAGYELATVAAENARKAEEAKKNKKSKLLWGTDGTEAPDGSPAVFVH